MYELNMNMRDQILTILNKKFANIFTYTAQNLSIKYTRMSIASCCLAITTLIFNSAELWQFTVSPRETMFPY